MKNKIMKALTRFSAINRQESINQFIQEEFDLIVIGGGATGCGIALDAASRGLKTLLLEKRDFASGTSSKSTKLIHGGLRYLKQFEIGLVRETGTERAIVHRLASHLVLPEKMLLPIIENGTYGKLAASFGLKVYDMVAGVSGKDKRKMLSKAKALEIEPFLDESVLKGAGFYAEYRTDDARLTIELMKTAARYGAKALNYCKVEDFVYEDGKVKAVKCTDQTSGQQFEVKAKSIVSAGGPWVDKLRKTDGSLAGKRLQLTKGVHIVVPHERFPLKYSVYFDVPDGRMMFAIPRGKITYIGTTDTTYHGDLNRVVATREDAAYILKGVKHAFPNTDLSEKDLISNWAGLRPLIHEDGKSPSELSRKDEIFISDTGLISIAGGKLTGYRKMAERIVDLVLEKYFKTLSKKSTTKSITLTPNPLPNAAAVETYIQQLEQKMPEFGLSSYHAWYLTTTYGQQTEIILNKIKDFSDKDSELRLLRAELWFGVHYEMVESLADFFVRRTGRLYFDIFTINPALEVIANDLQEYLNWEDARLVEERERMQTLLYDATHYYEKELVS
ncbi:MAG: glycerol-3-phosphate dehydrogenase/oxidase [Bacteroidota bacterium]